MTGTKRTRAVPAPLRCGRAARPEHATELRVKLADWMRSVDLADGVADRVVSATYEAMANAVDHAYPDGHPGEFVLSAAIEDDDLVVRVADRGRWRAPTAEPGTRGRGLVLLRGLSDKVSIVATESGTTVEMRWPLLDERPDPGGAEDQLRRIESVTDSALAELDPERLPQQLLQRVREVLAADTVAVLLHDRPAGQLYVAGSVGVEWEVPRGVRILVGEGLAGRVAATRRPAVQDTAEEPPAPDALPWEQGLRALLGVPMQAAGDLIGVLHVGSRAARDNTARDIQLLQLVADRIALVTQEQLSRPERAAVTALQRSLLPARLPPVPGLEFDARYIPGALSGVGGDWYDVLDLPEERVGVVIGDVAGHGLPAAVVMGRLRSALRAYALDSDDPAEVLSKLDRKAVHFEAGEMATVAYAVIDLPGHTMRLSLAGHPPPVLSVPGESPCFVPARIDPPIGFGLRTRARRSAATDLPADSTLCLYTDGLVERRGEAIDDNLDRLSKIVPASLPVQQSCRAVMRAFVGVEPPEDDIALVVAHRVGEPRATRSGFRHE